MNCILAGISSIFHWITVRGSTYSQYCKAFAEPRTSFLLNAPLPREPFATFSSSSSGSWNWEWGREEVEEELREVPRLSLELTLGVSILAKTLLQEKGSPRLRCRREYPLVVFPEEVESLLSDINSTPGTLVILVWFIMAWTLPGERPLFTPLLKTLADALPLEVRSFRLATAAVGRNKLDPVSIAAGTEGEAFESDKLDREAGVSFAAFESKAAVTASLLLLEAWSCRLATAAVGRNKREVVSMSNISADSAGLGTWGFKGRLRSFWVELSRVIWAERE